jgi:hypothetical protein
LTPTIASVATFQLDATTRNPLSAASFSLIFDDANGDALFSLNELVSFPAGIFFTFAHETIEQVPTIAGTSLGSSAPFWGLAGHLEVRA